MKHQRSSDPDAGPKDPPEGAEPGGEATPEGEPALNAELQTLRDERDQLRDQLMRTMAEFQNFRKRTESDRLAHRRIANERLILDLLPVLDNFERTFFALQSGSSLESIAGGIQAVERQLRTVLESHEVRRIDTAGAAFDPALHEAVAAEPSDEHPPDTVTSEVEPGYRMGEKVIRPARVRVAQKK